MKLVLYNYTIYRFNIYFVVSADLLSNFLMILDFYFNTARKGNDIPTI